MPAAAKPPVGSLTRHIAGVLRAKAARDQISQTTIAEAIGISQAQVSKYLRGTKAPNVDELEAIAAALGLSYLDVVVEAQAQLGASKAEREDLRSAIERVRPSNPPTPRTRRDVG